MTCTGAVAAPTRLRGPAHTGWCPRAPARVLRTPGDQPGCENTTAPIMHGVHRSSESCAPRFWRRADGAGVNGPCGRGEACTAGDAVDACGLNRVGQRQVR